MGFTGPSSHTPRSDPELRDGGEDGRREYKDLEVLGVLLEYPLRFTGEGRRVKGHGASTGLDLPRSLRRSRGVRLPVTPSLSY